MELTEKQYEKLRVIRKDLINNYNKNITTNYLTIRDFDYIMESLHLANKKK